MPEQRIDPELVEKAAKAMWAHGPTTARPAWEELSQRQREFALHEARAALRVVIDGLRLKEERKRRWTDGDGHLLAPDGRTVEAVRLVSKWRPVEQGDTK